jgi:hypothetical protein
MKPSKTPKSSRVKKSGQNDPQENKIKKLSVFDHVKHIRQIQNPNYYIELSDGDKKSFDHFMIIRALSMDSSIVEDMAALYQYFDKIPSAQFYTLLIALVPKTLTYHKWIKTKQLKHKKELLKVVAKKFEISTYQANEYVNLLLRSENGQGELIKICKSFGLEDNEVNELFEERKYDK